MTTLNDLEPGDFFVHAKSRAKNPKKYMVLSMPEFNARHGGSTRKCVDLFNNNEVGKSCRLEVIKVGQSLHKAKIMEMYAQPKTKKP